MARVNDITPDQKRIAEQMRGIRLKMGMSKPVFGGIVEKDSGNVTSREIQMVPWKASELEIALPAMVKHLKECLQEAESLANTLVPENTQKTHES
jgi:hypothetical protein